MSEQDDFINHFREQLHHVDDFIAVTLNAHLEIEGHLDEYIGKIFEHPKYLEEARLSFYDKVCITRAYTPLSHDRPEWEMMALINAMRNKIAHRSRLKALRISVSPLRSTMEKTSDKLRAELKGLSHKDVVVYAAAFCCGFLAIMEEQLARHKGMETDDE